MSKVVRVLASACLMLALQVLTTSFAYGQGGTTSTLSGVAVDSSGAILPGADVTIKHAGTGLTQNATTNTEGAFSFPGMSVGSYTVTVTLSGFKTFISNNVVLTSGAPASVRATLEIGGLEEQVVVSSASEIVQTQSTTVSSTINTSQITKLPLTSRSAMDFVNFLPGVSTPAGNRDATINGLPRGTINITLDGVNIQDNTLRSTDGFFALVSPRLDAIEEVTVTSANQGADAGQGAVQIKFITRSGTNDFNGSGYWYYRNDNLNANTWFNNRSGTPKAELLQNQGGIRVGGPIVIPGLFDGRSKAFFFANYEELRQPSDTTRQRTILNPAAMAGNFTFTGNGATQTVNVLDLAARNGQLATPDPTVAAIMRDISGAVSGGSLETIDANLQRYTFNVPVETMRRFPTFRLDYNLTDKHRATFSYNYQKYTDYPDTLNNAEGSFPGFPVGAGQSSVRLGWSGSVRSTLTSTIVNEARLGYTGAPVTFFGEYNTGMFTGSAVNQQGFSLRFPTINSALTSPGPAPAPQSRNANSLLIEDTVSWLKGSHNISFGGSFTQYDIWALNSNLVPRVNFDILASDPANSLFTAANFPGASTANLQGAQRLFNLLTGRISSITGDARLDEGTGEYTFMGTGRQNGRLREGGFYVQDSWRVRSNLTLNAGLRYDVQMPFYALNSLYSFATIDNLCGVSGAASESSCNLFKAGVMPGSKPVFDQLTKGTRTYDVDYNNWAPNVGVAWTPGQRSGALGTMMGNEGDFVLRAGYARAFSRGGLNDFTSVFNANPGIVISATREEGQGNLGGVPLLLREPGRLGPPAFASTPVYPMTDVVTEDIRGFDPSIKVPYADTWSAGMQRGIGSSMALEVRYVGTRGKEQWRALTNGGGDLGALNYNEFNIFDNGFINEFRVAQSNLRANIAAGRGNTFAYTGAPGTSPLPTFLAFFNGQNASQSGNAALYTGGNWTNQNYLNFLAVTNPNPFGFASAGANGLMGTAALRANAATAGVPANYFVANPDLLGGAFVTTNIGSTKYDALQIELRKRQSHGLQFQTSYVYGKAYASDWETFRAPQFYLRDAGTPGDLTHQFKFNVVYDLPFGTGRKFGGNSGGFMDRIIGGWQVGWNARIQSGRLVELGNVRMVGMSREDVEGMFELRFDNDGKKVWMLPQDVIENSIRAFSTSPTTASGYAGESPTGRYFMPANGPDCIEIDNGAEYGDCGMRSLVVTGPMFQQHDIRVAKRIRLTGTTDFEFSAEMLNAFNKANFVPVGGIGSTQANYEVTTLTGTNTARVIQLVGRFNW